MCIRDRLKRVDTDSEDFKNFVRMLNLTSRTRYEELQKKKKEFRKLMRVMAGLKEQEKRAFIHLLKN